MLAAVVVSHFQRQEPYACTLLPAHRLNIFLDGSCRTGVEFPSLQLFTQNSSHVAQHAHAVPLIGHKRLPERLVPAVKQIASK